MKVLGNQIKLARELYELSVRVKYQVSLNLGRRCVWGVGSGVQGEVG